MYMKFAPFKYVFSMFQQGHECGLLYVRFIIAKTCIILYTEVTRYCQSENVALHFHFSI